MDIFQLDNHVYLLILKWIQSVNLTHTFQASKKHQDHIPNATPNRKEVNHYEESQYNNFSN